MRRIIDGPLITALALVTAAPVQAQAAPDAVLARVPAAGRSCALALRGGTPCADGADYRAVFDARGVTFTPALGRRAPRPLPVRFAVAGIRRAGGVAVPLATDAALQTGDLAVTYARAPGIDERYRVTPRGIELSFRFARPLAGTGDLVVRVRVESELASDGALAADGSLRFTRGALGGVRVGGVTGIDALGRTVPGTLRVDGEHLELRLPGTFVDVAAYPLVLDPLIGTDFGVVSGSDDKHADIAYDHQSSTYCVVWERALSLTDVHVLAQLLDLQGSPVGSLLVVRDTANTQALRPVVAGVRMRGRFVVAWQDGASIIGPWNIMLKCINPTGAQSTIVQAPASQLAQLPRLGGSSLGNDDAALLVWQEGATVRASRIPVPSGTAAPLVNPPATLASGGQAIIGLAVTKTCGPGARWVVAYSKLDLSSELRAQAVSLNGGALGPALSVAGPVLGADFFPAVAGDGTNYKVAYRRASNLHCRAIRFDAGQGQLVAVTGEVAVSTDPARESDVAISLLGPKYLVTWTRTETGLLDTDVHGITLDPLTCLPCGQPFSLPRPTTRDFGARIASRLSGSPFTSSDDAMIVFTAAALTSPFDGEIRAQRFEAMGNGGNVQNVGGGCGGPYSALLTGPFAVGNRSLQLRVTGVQGATAVLLGIGVPAPPITCGTCMVTPPIVPLFQADHRGDLAIVPFPLECSFITLLGATVEFQWWVVASNQPHCPLAPPLTFSDRIQATVGL